MADYLIAMDTNETPLGYLSNAKNIEVRERLNGEALLSFEIAYDVTDANHLQLEGFIKHDTQLYVIKEIEQSDSGKRTLTVRAVHVYVELVDEYIDRVVELFGVTAYQALDEALQGTSFTIGSAPNDSTVTTDFDLSEISVLKAVQEIREKFDLDLWFDNRTVYLGSRGQTNVTEIRYGKNLKSLRRPSSTSKVITRLYPYGRDGLTIEGVNGGVKYLDSANINDYAKPKKAEKRWNDITDPDELKEAAERYLADNDSPKISYQTDWLELEAKGATGIGDSVTITHMPFDLKATGSRVVELTRFPYEPLPSYATLSSYKETDAETYFDLKKKQYEHDHRLRIVNKSPVTYVIADGSTSVNKAKADFVVPVGSTSAQATVNNVLSKLGTNGGRIVLLDGTYIIDGSINLKSNVIIEGNGASTVIKVKDGFASNLSILSASNVNNVILTNFKVDGSAVTFALDSPSINAFYFDTVTYSIIDKVVVDYVTNNGVTLLNSDENLVINSRFYDCYNACIKLDQAKENKIKSNVIKGRGVGVEIYDFSNDNEISSNTCNDNNTGIRSILGGEENKIIDNTCNSNNEYGIWLTYLNRNTVKGNKCSRNVNEGILIDSAHDNVINGNICINNGYRTDINSNRNIYSQIKLVNGAKRNNIQGNTARNELETSGTVASATSMSVTLDDTTANDYVDLLIRITGGTGAGQKRIIVSYDTSTKEATVDSSWTTIPDTTSSYEIYGHAKYGIYVSESNCEDNVVTNNHVYNSGITGDFVDAGTNTITTAGNA